MEAVKNVIYKYPSTVAIVGYALVAGAVVLLIN